MQKIYFRLLIYSFLLSVTTQAQNYCGTPRFDTEVFTTVDTTNNVVYGSATNVNNSTQILKMDIYQPLNDTATKRPLIVFAHGGSFIGGSKTDVDVVSLCNHFAKRGYVCASIDYRLGMGFPIDSVNATKAVLRATQDMKAAVRFFRKDAYTANAYMIDTNYIFVGGSSAGAFMGVHLAYLDKPSEVPSWINISSLGGLDGVSGNPGYLSTAKAVINLCGALGDSAWIEPGDIPMVSLHGNNDQTVPYCTDMIYVLSFPIMVVDGSKTLNDRCNNLGIPNPFYTWYGKDHVPYYGTSSTNLAYMDTTVRFVSNFLYTQLGCTPSNANPLPNAPMCIYTAVYELSNSADFKIYPNPSDGNFYLELTNNNANSSEVIISDITGRIIFDETYTGNLIHIEKAGLPKGFYFVQLISDDKSLLTRKITVQ